MRPKLRLPSFRAGLLRLNRDVLDLHYALSEWSYPQELCNLDIMIVLLEDRRFFNHIGIDLKSFAREIWRAITLRRHGGASTIDMQFVRTVTGYKKKKISRKLYESILSMAIHSRYTKMQILRGYMNCAYFGWGLRGVSEVSHSHFGNYYWELTFQQAAEVASMLVYPKPKLVTASWMRKIERRAEYGMKLYARHKKRFDKLNVSEFI